MEMNALYSAISENLRRHSEQLLFSRMAPLYTAITVNGMKFALLLTHLLFYCDTQDVGFYNLNLRIQLNIITCKM